MKTVLEVIQSGSVWLETRGIESARLNLELLLAHQLGLNRMQLYLRFEEALEAKVLTQLRESMRRRASGEPLQHILGSVDFLGQEFCCDSRALIPRPETEVLVERCLELPLPEAPTILDLATGSGVIALSLAAALPQAQLSASDLSSDALVLAQENAGKLDLSEHVCFLEGDLFAALPKDKTFDLIVTNLPYIPSAELSTLATEVQHDPALALDGGPDGLDLVRRVVADLPERLNPGGFVAFEVAHDQGPATLKLLSAAGLIETGLWSDLEGIPRFPHARVLLETHARGEASHGCQG